MMLQSKPLAEEAVQNALIELYSTIVSGKEIKRLHGWFSRLLANRAVDIARKEQGNKITVDINAWRFSTQPYTNGCNALPTHTLFTQCGLTSALVPIATRFA